MKTIFDKPTRDEIIIRIAAISADKSAQWGKMNVYQMVEHNTYWNGWMLGKDNPTYSQTLLGKVFGRMALRKMIKDAQPFDRNIPTSSQFKAKETGGDLEAEKLIWISLTEAYESYDNPAFIHDFFGKMTKEQVGILVYKHSDHHLRQFGV
ncbi:DUF1569 domain-containing protein [Pontibacter indicus]|uniref:DUF1569 domain-containing protein n=1 Tax=Pontibacter indicus TaxID=1317125 RepID=A0A1R3W7A4_9BACT|nr:DUF1569 domain-containing protein [Pontibacter indicus]SIT73544.1 Protein of unknown function [Pontibacter indicus]